MDDGRLKNIYGTKSDVSMFVLQFVRSNTSKYLQSENGHMTYQSLCITAEP